MEIFPQRFKKRNNGTILLWHLNTNLKIILTLKVIYIPTSYFSWRENILKDVKKQYQNIIVSSFKKFQYWNLILSN